MNIKPKVKIKCKHCNKEIEVTELKAKKRKFCSKKCYHTYNRGKNNPMFGKKRPDVKKRKGKKNPRYNEERHKKHYCIEAGCGKEISYSSWFQGNQRCLSCARKKLWQDEDFRNRTLQAQCNGLKLKPNKPEKLLNTLLQQILPNEYKINVRGEVMIFGGKIPDFVNVNGQKKIVELFGNYWHSNKFIKKHGCYEDTETGRKKYFKQLGWDTLIIWEKELKNLNKVKNKILEFNNQ